MTLRAPGAGFEDGVALVPARVDGDWIYAAQGYAAGRPTSRRFDIDIVDSFLGIAGALQHYIIFIVPPQP